MKELDHFQEVVFVLSEVLNYELIFSDQHVKCSECSRVILVLKSFCHHEKKRDFGKG